MLYSNFILQQQKSKILIKKRTKNIEQMQEMKLVGASKMFVRNT